MTSKTAERTEAQISEEIEAERAALAAAKSEGAALRRRRAEMLLVADVDAIMAIDEQSCRANIKVEIAAAKIPLLESEADRFRAERARWAGVDLPTDSELARLMSIVSAANPWLLFPPKTNSLIARDSKGEFKRAFFGLGLVRRLAEPTQKIAWSTHVDRLNSLLRGCGHSEVDGDAAMAAVLAWNDIPWRKADPNFGQPLEVGLDPHSGRPCTNAWRELLSGSPLRQPLAPRGQRAA